MLRAKSTSVAAPPGTLKASADALETQVRVMAYGPTAMEEGPLAEVGKLAGQRATYPVVWVDVVGLADVQLLKELGAELGLHDLALEDVVNVHQRPKVEVFGDVLFLVTRMPRGPESIASEQISLFLGPGFVVTFQEREGDPLEGVRKRIRDERPRLRGRGPDYLLYALFDAVLDAYFPVLDHIANSLEDIEGTIVASSGKESLRNLHEIKSDLMQLRRVLRPTLELAGKLAREDVESFQEETRPFLRDCQDHALQAVDLVDSCRDTAVGLEGLLLALAGQRMNEVMKVLTIIATIFMPLSFIAGLYGMNFDPSVSRWNMPELAHPYGYPLALGFMGLSAVIMFALFWRRGWFK